MTKKEAQLALANLKRYMSGGGSVDKDTNRAIDMAIEELSQPEPHWIPVTERLPKEDGNYLVSGKWWSGKESVGDCEFSVEDGYFRTAWNFDVLAWRELPESYKGVTDGRD